MLPLLPKKKHFRWLRLILVPLGAYVYISFSYQNFLLHPTLEENHSGIENTDFEFPGYFKTLQEKRQTALNNLKMLQKTEKIADAVYYQNESLNIQNASLSGINHIIDEQRNRLSKALFTDEVTSYIDKRGGEISIAVYNKLTNQTYVYNADKTFKTASIMKVSVMASLFLQNGFNDTTEDQVSIMIRESDNDAVDLLWNQAGGDQGFINMWKKMGLTHTTLNEDGHWGLTTTTAVDQVRLIQSVVYRNDLFTADQQQKMKDYMVSVVPNQKWGVSAGIPSSSSIAIKNGWSPSAKNNWRINSIGHIQDKTHDYAIAILTFKNPSDTYGIETINHLSTLLYPKLSKN